MKLLQNHHYIQVQKNHLQITYGINYSIMQNIIMKKKKKIINMKFIKYQELNFNFFNLLLI